MKLIVNNKQKDVADVKAATREFQERCGGFFREKRILRRKSEEEVAKLLRIPVQKLRDYECGKEAIPLYQVDALSRCLHISSKEIIELHQDLEEQIMPKPLFEQHFIDDRDVGRLVLRARKTVSLSAKNLAELMTRSGHPISESEILQIEREERAVSPEFWLNFCTLTHLHPDSIHGYSRWQHLARVEVAFGNETLRIPAGPKLFNALENYRAAIEANTYKASYLLRFSTAFGRRKRSPPRG